MRRRVMMFLCLIPLLVLVTQCQNMSRSMSISSLEPNAGTALGGNEVTIRGSNFSTNSTVSFGGLAATVASATSSSILVNVPAPAAGETGEVDVVVTDALGNSATRVNGYSYRTMLFCVNHGSNDVSSFNFNNKAPSLQLFSTTNSPSGGAFPASLGVDAESQLAFVANTQTVGVFDYSFEDGVLTQIGSAVSAQGTGVVSIAVDSTHDVLFTANSNDNTISSFTYDPDTGETTYVEQEIVGAGGTQPWDVAVDESQRLLFVVNRMSNNMSVFTYTALGDMTLAGPPVGVSGTLPTAVAVDPDPSRRLVFVAMSGSNEMESLSYTTAGALTSKHSRASDGTIPYDVAVDADRQLMFVINQGGSTVRGFEYDANGVMTPAPGTAVGTGGAMPYSVVLDTAGGHAFVANEGASSIGLFEYGADGSLSAVGLSIGANGTNPRGLVFVP